jgi:hypothetical protein
MKKEVSQEIKNYIKKQTKFSIPQLQVEFSLSYYEAHRIVEALLKEKSIEFCGGIEYKYSVKESTIRDVFDRGRGFTSVFESFRRQTELEEEQRKKALREQEAKEVEDDFEEVDEAEDSDDSDDEADNDDDETGDETADNDAAENPFAQPEVEALRKRVLKYCIDHGRASPSMIQMEFHIGFVKACEVVEWMESKGYISAYDGLGGRKTLISKEEFNRIYGTGASGQTVGESEEEHVRRIKENYRRVIDAGDDKDEEGEDDKADNIDRESEVPDGEEMVINFTQDLPFEKLTEENVTDCLHQLIKSDKEMTRIGAIRKVMIYMNRARAKNHVKSLILLKKVMLRLEELTDYKYKKLRQQLCGEG